MRTGVDAATLAHRDGREEYFTHIRFRVANGSGTLVDLSDRVQRWSYNEPNADQPVAALTVELLRELNDDPTTSLAPFFEGSTANRLDDGATYAPALELGRAYDFSTALTALDAERPADDSPLWYEQLSGAAIRIAWPERYGNAVVQALDKSGRLQKEQPEAAYTYAAGTAIEAAAQQALNDRYGAGAYPLSVPVATGAVLQADYAPSRQKPEFQIQQELAQSIGFVTWNRYTGVAGSALTLFEPNREKSVSDATVPRVRDLTTLEVDQEQIANVLYGQYVDSSGVVQTVGPVEDTVSIAKYGGIRRVGTIAFGEDSTVRTEAAMLAVLGKALSDMADPDAVVSVTLPYYPFAECAVDLLTFTANGIHFDTDQQWAPYSITHSGEAGALPQTVMELRGKPSAGYRTWAGLRVNDEVQTLRNALVTLTGDVGAAITDNAISAAERKAIGQDLKRVAAELADVQAAYIALRDNDALPNPSDARTALASAWTAYGAPGGAHPTLVAAINALIADETVTQAERDAYEDASTDYAAKLGALSTALQGAQAAITRAVAGTAIVWQGTYASEAELIAAKGQPENGWAYQNSTTSNSYIYQGGAWYLLVPGGAGEDGVSAYVHIKYSNDGGTTFTPNGGETPGDWIGIYGDNTQADSADPADYTWSKTKGDPGAVLPTVTLTPTSETTTQVVLRIDAAVGLHGTGPLEYRTNRGADHAWTGWVAYPSTPPTLTVARPEFWFDHVLVEVKDADGNVGRGEYGVQATGGVVEPPIPGDLTPWIPVLGGDLGFGSAGRTVAQVESDAGAGRAADTDLGAMDAGGAISRTLKRILAIDRGGTQVAGGDLFQRGVNTLGDVLDHPSFRRIGSAFSDVSNRLINVYRGGVTESVGNLFKRGSDTLDSVLDSATFRRIGSAFSDGNNRLINVFRGGITESTANLFKRGVDTLDQVLDSPLYRRTTHAEADQASAPSQNLLGPDAGAVLVAPAPTYFDHQPLLDLNLSTGETISAGLDIHSDAGADSLFFRLSYYDGAGTLLRQDESNHVASGGYVRAVIESVTIPSGTVSISMYTVWIGNTETHTWRRAMLNRGPIALPYDDPPLRSGRETQDDLRDGSVFRRIGNAFSDASNRLINVYRAGATESVGNLFKKGSDTLADVLDSPTFRRIGAAFSDASNRLVNVYRAATTESVDNLFKRGSNTASDVVATGARTFVHPDYVDGSLRPDLLRNGASDIPAANVFRRGTDTLADVLDGGGFVRPTSAQVAQATAPSQNLLGAAAAEEFTGGGSIFRELVVSLAAARLSVGDTVSISALMHSATGADRTQVGLVFRSSTGSTIDEIKSTAIQTAAFGRVTVEAETIPAGTVSIAIRARNVDQTESATIKQWSLNRGPVALIYQDPPYRPGRESASDIKGASGENVFSGAGRLYSQRNNLAVSVANKNSTTTTGGYLQGQDAGASASIVVGSFSIKFGFGTVAYTGNTIPGLAFSRTYYVYCDDPGLTGGAVTYIATENGVDLIANGRIYVGECTTPADGGTAPPGGGGAGCIALDAWLGPELQACEAVEGDLVDLWIEGSAGEVERAPIQLAYPAKCVECVELSTPCGARLVLGRDTPMVLRSGETIRVEHANGEDVLVDDGGRVRWERATVTPVGVHEVRYLSVGGGIYAAGAEPTKRIFTHNSIPIKPQ